MQQWHTSGFREAPNFVCLLTERGATPGIGCRADEPALRPCAAIPITRASTGAPVATSENRPALTDEAKAYVVQKRDNLWKIATEHGVTVAALRQANPRLRGGLLTVGSELVIP